MKLEEGIHLIDGTMANSYFIENGGKGILVDTGTKASAGKILSFLKNNDFNLDTVLITHYHMDHIGGLSTIYSKLKPKVFVPDTEVGVVKGNEKPQMAKSLMPKLVGAIAHPKSVSDVSPVSEFKSGDIDVIATNGHTPGSTSYYLKDRGILFVGDALVNNKGELKINKTFTLDMKKAEESREKILNSGARLILSGHGDPYYLKK